MTKPAAMLAISTCPDADGAAHIARVLVEEGLAACATRVPGVQSTYRWQGSIHQDAEVLLLLKTTRERFAALQARLLELHPAGNPELLAVPIEDGAPAYLAWLAEAVAQP